MTAAESQTTDDLDELDALRAAYNLPGEDQVDRDPVEARTIPAGWGTERIERYLRRLMRNPGEYTVSFAGRISHEKVKRIVAAVNKNYGVWEGGMRKGWDYEHHDGGRPMILLNSPPHGPHPSEEGELPWGGLYTQPDSSKGPRVPETNRSATAAPPPEIPVFPSPAELQTRQRLSG
jgi:hypothetical protein